LEESSIIDSPPDPVSSESFELTYSIVENASNKGKAKLFDSAGYEYALHKRTAFGSTWRCVVRNKKVNCGILVKQYESEFYQNAEKSHCHPPKTGAKAAAIVIANSKNEASKKPFVSASQIIKKHIQKEVVPSHAEALPAMENMIRSVNLHRQKKRPKDPTDKNFELFIESLPRYVLS